MSSSPPLDGGRKVRSGMQDGVAAEGVVGHDLEHYLRPLRRQARLVVACVVAGLILGGIVAFLLRPTYVAATRVLIGALPQSQQTSITQQRTSGPINPDQEAQIVKSSTVGTLAQQVMKTHTAVGALLGRITVSVPANTPILRIECKAHSISVAKTCAGAFANAYLQNRKNTAQQQLNDAIAKYETEITAARKDQTSELSLAAQLQNGTTRRKVAIQQANLDSNKINAANTQISQLQGTPINPGQIVSAPSYVGKGSSSREIVLLAGLVLGLLGGIVAAILRERLDPVVRSADDLDRMGIPVVAEVPAPPTRRQQHKRVPVTADDGRVRADQRTATVLAALLSDEGGTIYISGVSVRQTPHHSAERLAEELGRFGSTVAVIHPYDQTTAATVSSQPAPDQATMATERSPEATEQMVSALGWPTTRPELPRSVSAALPEKNGSAKLPTAHDAPTEALGREPSRAATAPGDLDVMKALRQVEEALRHSRYVVIAGEHAAAGSEAYLLASLSQASLLVVEPGVTSRADLADAVEQIKVTTSTFVGALLWRPPANSAHARWRLHRTDGSATPPEADTTGQRLSATVLPVGAGRPKGDGGPRALDAAH